MQTVPTSSISVGNLYKDMRSAGRVLHVLEEVNIDVSSGEFVSIIGPSGCGKTTLLNILAGLDEPTSGSLELKAIDSGRRLGQIAYMQQNDLLLPWRSVIDNATLGLEVGGIPKWEAKARAQKLMPRFGLGGFENLYPAALSGGMRQRVAFLRTILTDRDVLLLDEPFGALDALTRGQMQEWLLGLWSEFRKTIVLVTHDVDEALFLSDRVYVLTARPGRVKMVVSVSLPRPRRYEMLTMEKFTDLKAQLLTAIREEAGATQSGPWR